jgi:sulfite reductase alpha subunit-like flavoprotein
MSYFYSIVLLLFIAPAPYVNAMQKDHQKEHSGASTPKEHIKEHTKEHPLAKEMSSTKISPITFSHSKEKKETEKYLGLIYKQTKSLAKLCDTINQNAKPQISDQDFGELKISIEAIRHHFTACTEVDKEFNLCGGVNESQQSKTVAEKIEKLLGIFELSGYVLFETLVAPKPLYLQKVYCKHPLTRALALDLITYSDNANYPRLGSLCIAVAKSLKPIK